MAFVRRVFLAAMLFFAAILKILWPLEETDSEKALSLVTFLASRPIGFMIAFAEIIVGIFLLGRKWLPVCWLVSGGLCTFLAYNLYLLWTDVDPTACGCFGAAPLNSHQAHISLLGGMVLLAYSCLVSHARAGGFREE